MRRKKQEQDVPASGDGRVTPEDVQRVEFRLAFRGYNERDVDAFLDRITEDLASYLEENQRLRAGAGRSGAPGEPDQVLERAQAEAAAIVRRAEEDAAALRAAAGAGAGDTRAAVAPFLNREREFLQGLGALVQGHAEEIKQMVLALRARAEAGSPGHIVSERPVAPETVPGAEAQAATEGEPQAPAPAERSSAFAPPADERSDTVAPASASEIAERLGLARPSPAPAGEPVEEPEAETTAVVIDPATEPAYSSEGASSGDRRDRSLRELFWGED